MYAQQQQQQQQHGQGYIQPPQSPNSYYRDQPQQAPPQQPQQRPGGRATSQRRGSMPPAPPPQGGYGPEGPSPAQTPQYNIPPPTRQKSKAYSTSLAAHSDDLKYQGKYKDLKRKVREIEGDNDKLHLKVLKTKRNIQRIRLERAILYERLAALGEIEPPPMPLPVDHHDPHAYDARHHQEQHQHQPPLHDQEDPRHYPPPQHPDATLPPAAHYEQPVASPQQPQYDRRPSANGNGHVIADEPMREVESGTGEEGGSGALQNLAVQALEQEENAAERGATPEGGPEGPDSGEAVTAPTGDDDGDME